MKLFKSKTSRIITVLGLNSVVLSVGVVIATISWYNAKQEIIPTDNVPSSILTGYFESGNGTQGNPYVITRPIHYYNLVKLQETNYGFDSNTYFQFGKQGLDTSAPTEYKFYSYDNNGVLQDGFSNYLNLQYYRDSRALRPLGSAAHPFVSQIDGKNMTVRNIHITGSGIHDIGIFGYVASSASITNLYFDGVDIDIAGAAVSNTGTHESHNDAYIGYIAGHIQNENLFTNVYVNNTCIRNSETQEFNSTSTYAFFGQCDVVSVPQSGGDSYHYSLDPSKVYNYFNDGNRYTSLQNQTLALRNTENNNIATQVSTAVTKSNSPSTHYSFVGDKYNSDQTRNFSLATTGANEMDDFYELEYYTGSTYSRSFNTATQVTSTAPASMNNTGTFVYYDENKSLGYASKWVYYTVSPQGSQTQQNFNCFLASYVDSGGTTHYLKNNSGTLVDVTNVTPTLPAANATQQQINTAISTYGDYYFTLKESQNSLGVASIQDGTEGNYYIFNPKNNAYLTYDSSVEPQTTSPCPSGKFTSTFANAVLFTLHGGRSGDIGFTHPTAPSDHATCGLVKGLGSDNSIYVKKITGQTPTVTITFTGITQSSESKTVNTFSKLTSTSNIGDNSKVAFVGYDTTNNENIYVAMSTTQNTNNRGRTDAITFTNDTFTDESLSGLATFTVAKPTNSTYTFFDPVNTGYIQAASSSKNYLHTVSSVDNNSKWAITLDSSDSYRATIVAQGSNSHKYLKYNFSADLFSCYESSTTNGMIECLIYYVTGTTTGYRYTSGARTLPFTADGGQSYTRTIYATYYKPINGQANQRQALDVSEDRISNWVFDDAGGSMIAFSQEVYEGWCRVTAADQLVAGETYVIAPKNPGTYPYTAGALGSGTTFGFNPVSTTFNADQSKINTLGEGTLQFTLQGSTGSWKFMNGDNYIRRVSGASSNGNPALDSEDSNNTFSIAINNGEATITASGGTTRLQYYSSGPYFRFYTSNQQSASLYRFYDQHSEETWFGDEIKANYDEYYDPDYVDAVGGVDFYSTYAEIDNGAVTNMKSMSYWDGQGSGAGSKFYQTFYTSSAIVLKVPNYGSLDYGTLTIKISGSTLPAFIKGGDAATKSVSFSDVECENEGTSSNPIYKLSLNPYNIYKLSYCTVDDNGNIYSAYDANGTKTVPSSTVYTENISEFILVIGCASGSTKITDLDLEFTSVVGNIGDFGTIGFRSATYTSGGTSTGNNINASTSTVPGQIINFTYTVDSGESIGIKVVYTAATNRYDITIYSSKAMTVYLFNYDAERAKVYVSVNGGAATRYRESYNEIPVTAAGSVPSGGFLSSYTVIS